MTARGRSYLLLGITLLIGMLLGALTVGALGRARAGRIEGMRHEDRFVRDMERILRPRDETQAAAIRPVLEATASRNREAMGEFDARMREALETLVRDLEPHLDTEQLARLQRFADRPPPPRRPPGRRPPPR
ncbi:MAG: hypothetical protein GKS06_00870 [Acidobacteria bacterium]|nr:hypothetical protein [Acidobacteriota bacterium]